MYKNRKKWSISKELYNVDITQADKSDTTITHDDILNKLLDESQNAVLSSTKQRIYKQTKPPQSLNSKAHIDHRHQYSGQGIPEQILRKIYLR